MNDRECDEIRKRIDKLEAEISGVNRSVTTLEVAVARADEQTKTLFSLLGEIKTSIDKIVAKVDQIDSKPDSFKEVIFSNSIKVLEKALIGGAIAYVLFKIKL